MNSTFDWYSWSWSVCNLHNIWQPWELVNVMTLMFWSIVLMIENEIIYPWYHSHFYVNYWPSNKMSLSLLRDNVLCPKSVPFQVVVRNEIEILNCDLSWLVVKCVQNFTNFIKTVKYMKDLLEKEIRVKVIPTIVLPSFASQNVVLSKRWEMTLQKAPLGLRQTCALSCLYHSL